MTVHPAAQLPPVTVDCASCGNQWISRARRHTPVHCPRCGHSVRVKRPGTAAGVQAADDGPGPAPASPAPASPPAASPRPAGATALPRALHRPLLVPGVAVERLAAPAAARPGPVPAAAPGRETTTAGALAALGWRISPRAGGCQIISGGRQCRGEAEYPIAGPDDRESWICGQHNRRLCKVIRAASLRQ
jgi:DNA-directed RNA polymerase subunit RPC12/RpoP